eukprot:947312-Pyramimonas_sp.AAC.1
MVHGGRHLMHGLLRAPRIIVCSGSAFSWCGISRITQLTGMSSIGFGGSWTTQKMGACAWHLLAIS